MLSPLHNVNFPFYRILLSERQSSITHEQVVTIDGDEVFNIDHINVVAASPPE